MEREGITKVIRIHLLGTMYTMSVLYFMAIHPIVIVTNVTITSAKSHAWLKNKSETMGLSRKWWNESGVSCCPK